MIRAGPLTVKNREVRYWQSRSSLFASTSTLVRFVITSDGPSRVGLPETSATACPVTVSTNATSEDASCAANGLRHEPRIIEARTAVFPRASIGQTPQIETTARGTLARRCPG